MSYYDCPPSLPFRILQLLPVPSLFNPLPFCSISYFHAPCFLSKNHPFPISNPLHTFPYPYPLLILSPYASPLPIPPLSYRLGESIGPHAFTVDLRDDKGAVKQGRLAWFSSFLPLPSFLPLLPPLTPPFLLFLLLCRHAYLSTLMKDCTPFLHSSIIFCVHISAFYQPSSSFLTMETPHTVSLTPIQSPYNTHSIPPNHSTPVLSLSCRGHTDRHGQENSWQRP
jgi:hypothetical protein